MINTNIKPGIIVNMRNRLWRIDEFDGLEVVATPITGDSTDQRVFLADVENIREERFEKINAELPGDLSAQRLLLRAYQFDLIHGSAPFLSLHRSSVVPYNYQMVPLGLGSIITSFWSLLGKGDFFPCFSYHASNFFLLR